MKLPIHNIQHQQQAGGGSSLLNKLLQRKQVTPDLQNPDLKTKEDPTVVTAKQDEVAAAEKEK